MYKQKPVKKTLLENGFIRNPFPAIILFFLVSGSNLSFGQTETRTVIHSSNTSGSSEKAKLEYQKTENPELHVMNTKIMSLDQEIRSFILQNQLPSTLTNQYLMKITSICSDCLVDQRLDASRVYVHINNPINSNTLLVFMEEFLTNLSNQ
jgi:hypothetical protein